MPHTRPPEAKARRMEAATLHVALQHARKREVDVGAREERVGRRERNAPELNDNNSFSTCTYLESDGDPRALAAGHQPATSPAIISARSERDVQPPM